MEYIQKIDQALEKVLHVKNTIICITADHSTPCSVGDHTADPVPVVIYGPGLRHDSVEYFNELDAMSGGLGHLRGHELLQMMAGLASRTPKFGA